MRVNSRERRHLLIVSCSRTKCRNSDLIPAWKRYRGRVFRILNKLLGDEGASAVIDVVIISAKYGFLRPNIPISDYDLRMTFELAEAHRADVMMKIHALCARHNYIDSFVLLEAEYLHALDLTGLPHPIVEKEISPNSILRLTRWIEDIQGRRCG